MNKMGASSSLLLLLCVALPAAEAFALSASAALGTLNDLPTSTGTCSKKQQAKAAPTATATATGTGTGCPLPNPALQALAGEANPLRACVVCPRHPGAVQSSHGATLSHGDRFKVVFRSEAREPTRVVSLEQDGSETTQQWLKPGERAAFFTTPGTWFRIYGTAGDVLLEHRSGLVAVQSVEDLQGDGSTGRRKLRHVSTPSGTKEQWQREVTRPQRNATNDAILTGFINLSEKGVEVLWIDFAEEEELVSQLEPREILYESTYRSHRFRFRDETGQTLHDHTVEEVVIPDCKEASRVAENAGVGLRTPLATAKSQPSFTMSLSGPKLF